MTLEDYQLFTLFKPAPRPVEKPPVYVGSGEDACLETFTQLASNKVVKKEKYEEIHS